MTLITPLPDAVTTLNPVETADLARHESTIDRGLKNFVEVGNALLDINDRRLYRATHTSFKDYVSEKWQMSVSRAYQLCEAAETVKSLPAEASTIVDTESKARELAKVPTPERASIVRLVRKRSESTGKKTTAKDIREAAKTEKPAPIDPAKFSAVTKSKKDAEAWWWTKSTAPQKRGQFILFLLSFHRPVTVENKEHFRQSILRWFEDEVNQQPES